MCYHCQWDIITDPFMHVEHGTFDIKWVSLSGGGRHGAVDLHKSDKWQYVDFPINIATIRCRSSCYGAATTTDAACVISA